MEKKSGTHSCPDCGPAPTNHGAAWMSVFLANYLSPIERALPRVSPMTMERAMRIFMSVSQFFRLGSTTYAPTEKDNWRTRALWEEAMRRGIAMEEFHLFGIGEDMMRAKFGGTTRCFDGLPRPDGEASEALEWMDNKPEMRKRFQAAGIPVARGGVAWSQKKADKIFDSLNKPVIVKPEIGSRSRHTTTHIVDLHAFHCACECAWKISPWVLIEEELEGPVFRGTIIGGKLQAVIRRDPASVSGDGVHTVRELVKIENTRPERQGPLFHHVPEEGEDADAHLIRQGVTWETVPEKGKIIALAMKTSRGSGGATTDVTDEMHPDNVALMQKISTVVNDPIIGVDFIMKDVRRSWKEQPKSGILECNSLPFIDLHHYPLNGRPRNIAAAVWDLVFPDSTPL